MSASAGRLYKAAWVEHPHDDHEQDESGIFPTDYLDYQEPEPEGWREYALEAWPDGPRQGEVWPNGYKPFFWPNTDNVFRSRSAAQYRVDIINRWGGRAVLVECTPDWVPVEVANRRRAKARLMERHAKKLVELLRIQAEIEQNESADRPQP